MSETILMKNCSLTNPAKNQIIPPCEDDSFNLYIKEISKIPSLSSTEEKKIAKLAHEGDLKAKQKLVQANLKLVLTIAKKVIHVAKLPMIDLIQEGNLGLMIAAEKFNYKLGYKFSTYASWWIKQSMFKAISEQAYCMKIPVYVQETLSKFSKIKSKMEQKYNCTIKNEDVAKEMNIEPNKIDMFLNAYNKSLSIEGEFELNSGKEVSMADVLVDEKASASKNIETEALKNDIVFIVNKLKEREAEVVKMRYGLDDTKRFTLEEIGNIYGVTKECIRQTEKRAINKIRLLVEREGLLAGYSA